MTKLLAPSLALGAGKILQHRVVRSTLWPVNFDNVMKMLSIHCKVNLPSSEVVFLNSVHEMRSFCALVFKPIKFLMISSFCILTIRMVSVH